MKNILLCDANFCVLPILKSIKNNKNCIVSVAGSNLNDPAHNIADYSINIDYSNVELLYKHIKENKYDVIVPGCNDRSYLSLAFIADKLNYCGFDNFETVKIIHEKDRFKTFAQKHNYPVAKSVTDIEDVDKLEFPLIIKPIDSFSGKGINVAYSFEEVYYYFQLAKGSSKLGLAVIEEFKEGSLFSHSAFIKDGKIVIDFFVAEYCTVYPYQVNSSNIATNLNTKVKDGMREWVKKFSQELNLCDGLLHTQFLVNKYNFYILEVTRRCPGDLYSQLIEKSTGIDYAKLYMMPFCGLEIPDKIEANKELFFSRHTVSVEDEMIFISSGVNIESKNIQNIQLLKSGDKLLSAPFGKSGIYFIEFDQKNKMEEITPNLKDYIILESLEIGSNNV